MKRGRLALLFLGPILLVAIDAALRNNPVEAVMFAFVGFSGLYLLELSPKKKPGKPHIENYAKLTGLVFIDLVPIVSLWNHDMVKTVYLLSALLCTLGILAVFRKVTLRPVFVMVGSTFLVWTISWPFLYASWWTIGMVFIMALWFGVWIIPTISEDIIPEDA
jgi:hypothetical protein